MMTHEQAYEQVLLALCIWREARSEGKRGMELVGHVIMNRTRRNDYPNTVVDVILDKYPCPQFSAMTVLGDTQTIKYPSPDQSDFQVAMEIASRLLTVQWDDPTHGAIIYRNPEVAPGGWIQGEVDAKRLVPTVKFKNHEFYAQKSEES